MRSIKVLCALVLSLMAAATIDIAGYRQQRVLYGLLRAASVRQLRRTYATRPWPDAATAIAYAVRLHDLGAADADDALVDAIPRTPVDFWYAFSVFQNHDTDIEQKLAKLYWRYWELAPDAVVRTNRGFRSFLQMSAWATSGEMLGQLQPANEELFARNRTAALRALKSLDRETQQRICNGADGDVPLCRADLNGRK